MPFDRAHYDHRHPADARQAPLKTEVVRHLSVAGQLYEVLENAGHHVLRLVAIDLARQRVVQRGLEALST